MTIAEGVSSRVVYKANSSGVMTAGTLADTSTIPGSSGGRILRRVASSLNFRRNSYAAQEIRTDRQEVDFRLGTGHVEGDISGELSMATYFDFLEAVHRDTKTSAVTLGASALTSVAASHSGSTITFGGGDPVSSGLFVGDVFRLTGASVSANNSQNFTIISFGGTSNRTVTVYPAPTDMSADTSFTVTRPGKATIIPSSSHVSRLFTFEHYASDLDYAQLFIENRVTKYALNLPATGLATIAVSAMGRWAYDLTGGSAPYFTAPSSETTTGIAAAVNGILFVSGTQSGIVTGVTLTNEMAPQAGEVVGQNFPAEIALGHNMVTGQVTAFLDGSTIPALFKAETEASLLIGLDATSAADTPTMKIFLPRIKFTASDTPLQGEGLQSVTAPFRALKYTGSTAGYPASTIRIVDTEA